MSFVTQLEKSGNAPIHFVTCKDDIGRDCFYFVMASYEKIKMLANIKDGLFDVNNYGKIVASGLGRNPSQKMMEELKDKFNFDADSLI